MKRNDNMDPMLWFTLAFVLAGCGLIILFSSLVLRGQ